MTDPRRPTKPPPAHASAAVVSLTATGEYVSSRETVRIHPVSAARAAFVPDRFLWKGANPALERHYAESTGLATSAAYFEDTSAVALAFGVLVVDGRLLCVHPAVASHGRVDAEPNASILRGWSPGSAALPSHLTPRAVDDDRVAVISQTGFGIYGHWLVDIMPRILFLEGLGFDGRYLLPTLTKSFQRSWLDAIGLPASRLIHYNPRTEALQLRRAIVPSPARYKSSVTDVLAPFLSRFAPPVGTTGSKRLFVSRGELSIDNRTLVNRAEVEALASAAGFEILRPEHLPLAEQIRLFANAAVIAGEQGSGLHNSVFAGPACRVLVLQSPRTLSFVQAGLCACNGQPVGFLFGTAAADGKTFSIVPADAARAFAQVQEMT